MSGDYAYGMATRTVYDGDRYKDAGTNTGTSYAGVGLLKRLGSTSKPPKFIYTTYLTCQCLILEVVNRTFVPRSD